MTLDLSSKEMPSLIDKNHINEDEMVLNRKIRKLSQSDYNEQQGLFNFKAILILIVWYITSFVVIILNKWTLDTMRGDPILLSKDVILLLY